MTLTLLIGVLASIRIVGLLQQDDFGPVEDLRSWIFHHWPGKNTEFYQSDVDGDSDYGWTLKTSGRAAFIDHHEDLEGEEGDPPVKVPIFVAVHPHPIGELYECPRCLGYWVSLGTVLAYLLVPYPIWLAVLVPLAMSQAVIWGSLIGSHR